jgi:hypothetical protein
MIPFMPHFTLADMLAEHWTRSGRASSRMLLVHGDASLVLLFSKLYLVTSV